MIPSPVFEEGEKFDQIQQHFSSVSSLLIDERVKLVLVRSPGEFAV